jgi:chemotaxis signal transduction protein
LSANTTESDLRRELGALRGQLAQVEQRMRALLYPRAPLPESFDVLLVRVGGVSAAFELDSVVEVIPAAAVMPVPEAPRWVLGVANLRGRTFPVADIGARLEARPARLELSDVIVVVTTPLGSAGFVVTGVDRVVRVERAAIEGAVHGAPHASYVLGTFPHERGNAMLFGAEALLHESGLDGASGDREETP